MHNKIFADYIFFPAASIYAGLIVPLSVGAMLGRVTWLQMDPVSHATSLLFGFAGALIAGYLLGKRNIYQLFGLFSIWFAARIIELFYAENNLPYVINALYGLLLSLWVAPGFMSASNWRNKSISPLLVIICCFPLIFSLAFIVGWSAITIMHLLVIFLAILMFYMGGRVLTPVVSRAYSRRGKKAPHRIQPRIEGAFMIVLASAGITLTFSTLRDMAAVLLMAAAVLVFIRVYRWQIIQVLKGETELLALMIGYFWIGAGLLALSCAMLAGVGIAESLHVVTIGALGTLSITIMLKNSLGRIKNSKDVESVFFVAIVSIFLSAILRFVVVFFPEKREFLLWGAVVTWSLAYWVAAWQIICINFSAQKARKIAEAG